MSAGSEHWLDRLAAPRTRRQGLKAALAGAALTLPFVRGAPARAVVPRADDPHACATGCRYTVGQDFEDALNACARVSGVGFSAASFLFLGPALLLGPVAKPRPNSKFTAKCLDVAAIQLRSQAYRCTQDNCPGFDPSGHNGPCEGCTAAHGNCCVYPADTLLGYFCCTISEGRTPCWCTEK